MISEGAWAVCVSDDDHAVAVVAYLLRTVCSMDVSRAYRAALEVYRDGEAVVAVFGDQTSAEELAVRLQRHSLRVAVRWG